MPRFNEYFTDHKGFFYPGETITGTIAVSLDEEIRFHKLTLKFKGKSYCLWTTGSGDDRKDHRNRQEYFKEEVVLSVACPESEVIPLAAGEYRYPFSFRLPDNLPPSFEIGRYTGYIKYYMKVKFHVDSGNWMKSQIQEKLPFKVQAAPADLSQTSHLLEPASREKDKFLCCLCCKSGPICLRCQVNKQAFTIGEPIVFSCELDNRETEKDLRKVEAKLVRELNMFGDCGERENYWYPECSLVLTEALQAGAEEGWQNVQLNVPSKTIPSFDNCKCFHISYQFVVEVDIPSAFDLEVSFPVVISNNAHTSQPDGVAAPVVPSVVPFGSQVPSTPAVELNQLAYPPPIVEQPSVMGNILRQPPPPYPVEELQMT